MLGTAAQIATLSCLSLRTAVGRRLLGPQEARDLALAAAGLLNIRGALVSCFAGLLFVCVVLSFVRSGGRCSHFHSRRGTERGG